MIGNSKIDLFAKGKGSKRQRKEREGEGDENIVKMWCVHVQIPYKKCS